MHLSAEAAEPHSRLLLAQHLIFAPPETIFSSTSSCPAVPISTPPLIVEAWTEPFDRSMRTRPLFELTSARPPTFLTLNSAANAAGIDIPLCGVNLDAARNGRDLEDPKVPSSCTLPDIAPTETSVPIGQRTSMLPDFDLTSRTGRLSGRQRRLAPQPGPPLRGSGPGYRGHAGDGGDAAALLEFDLCGSPAPHRRRSALRRMTVTLPEALRTRMRPFSGRSYCEPIVALSLAYSGMAKCDVRHSAGGRSAPWLSPLTSRLTHRPAPPRIPSRG